MVGLCSTRVSRRASRTAGSTARPSSLSSMAHGPVGWVKAKLTGTVDDDALTDTLKIGSVETEIKGVGKSA